MLAFRAASLRKVAIEACVSDASGAMVLSPLAVPELTCFLPVTLSFCALVSEPCTSVSFVVLPVVIPYTDAQVPVHPAIV